MFLATVVTHFIVDSFPAKTFSLFPSKPANSWVNCFQLVMENVLRHQNETLRECKLCWSHGISFHGFAFNDWTLLTSNKKNQKPFSLLTSINWPFESIFTITADRQWFVEYTKTMSDLMDSNSHHSFYFIPSRPVLNSHVYN